MSEFVIYTEDDELLGKENRDLRRNLRLINEELSKYSYKTIREFDRLFPAPKITAYDLDKSAMAEITNLIEVVCKEFVQEQKELKALVLKNPNELFAVQYSREHISFSDPANFWKRWKRFKKLKAFI